MRVSIYLFFSVAVFSPFPALGAELPINQYSAFQVLANFNISSIQLPKGIEEDPITLKGTDLNDNSVRDDFEKALLEHYQQPEYVALGILAALQWQKMVNIVADNNVPLSEREAHLMFNTDNAISQCYTQLQKNNPKLFHPADAFFNTSLRTSAKHAAERKLTDIIDPRPHKHMGGITGKPACYVFKMLFDTYVPEDIDQL